MPLSLGIVPNQKSPSPSNTTGPAGTLTPQPGGGGTPSLPSNTPTSTGPALGGTPVPGATYDPYTGGNLPNGMTWATGNGITDNTSAPQQRDPAAAQQYGSIASTYAPGSEMASIFNFAAANPSAVNPLALQQDMVSGNAGSGPDAMRSLLAGVPGYNPNPTPSPSLMNPIVANAQQNPGNLTPAVQGLFNASQQPTQGTQQTLTGSPILTPGQFSATNGGAPMTPWGGNGNGGTAGPWQSPQQNYNSYLSSLTSNQQFLGPLLSLFNMLNGGGGGTSGGSLWSQLFGGGQQGTYIPNNPAVSGLNNQWGGPNSGSPLASLMSLFGQPGIYNPYNLPLYTRQQMQWPQFP